jgi:hypothetical protein
MMQRMFYIKYSRKSLNFEQRKTAARYFLRIFARAKYFLTNFANIFGEDVGADGDLVGYSHLLPLCRLGGRLHHCTQTENWRGA